MNRQLYIRYYPMLATELSGELKQAFEHAYFAALVHAETVTGSVHFGCVAIFNDTISEAFCNTSDCHSEVNCLATFNGICTGQCLKCN